MTCPVGFGNHVQKLLSLELLGLYDLQTSQSWNEVRAGPALPISRGHWPWAQADGDAGATMGPERTAKGRGNRPLLEDQVP